MHFNQAYPTRHLRKEDSSNSRIELIVHYSPTIDAPPPPIIFFNRRVDPCHFQRNTRDLRLVFFFFFFTRFEKSRTIDPRASIIPRRAFNRGVQFALRPAHFLPLGENGRRSFPTINNPCLGDESYFSPAFRIS